MPSAALIDVLEWPTPKVSYSLSARVGKRREAALLLDGVQLVAAAGEHLVRIGLVADVPHEAVARRVEHVVQRDGELDGAEAGGEMPAARARRSGSGSRAARAQSCAQLRCRQRAQVGRASRCERSSGYWSGASVIAARSLHVAPARDSSAKCLAGREPTRKSRQFASGASRAPRGVECGNGAVAARARLRRATARRPSTDRVGRLAACGVRAGALAEQRWCRPRRRGCRPGSGRRDRSRAPNSSSARASRPVDDAGGDARRAARSPGSARRSCGDACSRARVTPALADGCEIDRLSAGHAARADGVGEHAHHLAAARSR